MARGTGEAMAEEVQRERLAELVAQDPAEPGFVALAESYRREHRLPDAERVLREGLEVAGSCEVGWSVLCLILLDQGRYDEARELLLQRADRIYGAHIGTHLFPQELSSGELDHAFESAEPERDELVDASQVAQAAMRAADLDAPEDLAFEAADSASAYATETMAALLARQGDGARAARIRESLAARRPAAPAPPAASRRTRAATLERWLHNLRALG